MDCIYGMNDAGELIRRDLKAEANSFTMEQYWNGEFDDLNAMFHELKRSFDCGAMGCDYERKGCQILHGDIVVDIGANIGLFAIHAIERGAKRVICFEPLRSNYMCLLQNIKNQPIEAYNLAISNETALVNLRSPQRKTTGHAGYKAKGEACYSEMAVCVTLDDLIDWGILSEIDFLKVDVEGAEMDVFAGLSQANLTRVQKAAIELHFAHDFYSEPDRKAFYQRMAEAGLSSLTVTHGSNHTAHFWRRANVVG